MKKEPFPLSAIFGRCMLCIVVGPAAIVGLLHMLIEWHQMTVPPILLVTIFRGLGLFGLVGFFVLPYIKKSRDKFGSIYIGGSAIINIMIAWAIYLFLFALVGGFDYLV